MVRFILGYFNPIFSIIFVDSFFTAFSTDSDLWKIFYIVGIIFCFVLSIQGVFYWDLSYKLEALNLNRANYNNFYLIQIFLKYFIVLIEDLVDQD